MSRTAFIYRRFWRQRLHLYHTPAWTSNFNSWWYGYPTFIVHVHVRPHICMHGLPDNKSLSRYSLSVDVATVTVPMLVWLKNVTVSYFWWRHVRRQPSLSTPLSSGLKTNGVLSLALGVRESSVTNFKSHAFCNAYNADKRHSWLCSIFSCINVTISSIYA